jgi:riboflavin synthase
MDKRIRKIGFADTTFSRFNYAPVVMEVFTKSGLPISVERYTVPGIKDLPVACKKLFRGGCEAVIACGMVGKMPIDKQCSHEASLGMQMVQTSEGKHIIEVFVHMDEAKDDRDLASICNDRAHKHAQNVLWLLFDQKKMQSRAGTGRRQGRKDAGSIKV